MGDSGIIQEMMHIEKCAFGDALLNLVVQENLQALQSNSNLSHQCMLMTLSQSAQMRYQVTCG